MSHRNHSVFPHPVLSPQRQDYKPDCRFEAVIASPVLTPHGDINIAIAYQIDCPTLHKYIEAGRAVCVSLVECSATYRRYRHRVSGVEDILILDGTELPDTFQLTPYITATKDIHSFWAEEFSSVTKALVPQGITLRAGSILAVGNAVEVDVAGASSSIFDLAAHSGVSAGTFATALHGERIAINLHRDDLQRIHQLRKNPDQSPLLYQALYLHSLSEALRGLEDHGHRRWAVVLRRKLKEHGIEVEGDDLSNKSEEYAQLIFQKPLSRMLDALISVPSHE